MPSVAAPCSGASVPRQRLPEVFLRTHPGRDLSQSRPPVAQSEPPFWARRWFGSLGFGVQPNATPCILGLACSALAARVSSSRRGGPPRRNGKSSPSEFDGRLVRVLHGTDSDPVDRDLRRCCRASLSPTSRSRIDSGSPCLPPLGGDWPSSAAHRAAIGLKRNPNGPHRRPPDHPGRDRSDPPPPETLRPTLSRGDAEHGAGVSSSSHPTTRGSRPEVPGGAWRTTHNPQGLSRTPLRHDRPGRPDRSAGPDTEELPPLLEDPNHMAIA